MDAETEMAGTCGTGSQQFDDGDVEMTDETFDKLLHKAVTVSQVNLPMATIDKDIDDIANSCAIETKEPDQDFLRLIERTRQRRELLNQKMGKTPEAAPRKRRTPLSEDQTTNVGDDHLTQQDTEDSPKRQCVRSAEQEIKADTPAIASVKSRLHSLASQHAGWAQGDQDNKEEATPTPTPRKSLSSPPLERSSTEPAGEQQENAQPASLRKSRFARLADNINNWEDDLSHPTIAKEEEKKPRWQPPKPTSNVTPAEVSSPKKTRAPAPPGVTGSSSKSASGDKTVTDTPQTSKDCRRSPARTASSVGLNSSPKPYQPYRERRAGVSPVKSPASSQTNLTKDAQKGDAKPWQAKANATPTKGNATPATAPKPPSQRPVSARLANWEQKISETSEGGVSATPKSGLATSGPVSQTPRQTATPARPPTTNQGEDDAAVMRPKVRKSVDDEPTAHPVLARMSAWEQMTAANVVSDIKKVRPGEYTPAKAPATPAHRSPAKGPGMSATKGKALTPSKSVKDSIQEKAALLNSATSKGSSSPSPAKATSSTKTVSPSKTSSAMKRAQQKLVQQAQNTGMAERLRQERMAELQAIQNRWKNGILKDESDVETEQPLKTPQEDKKQSKREKARVDEEGKMKSDPAERQMVGKLNTGNIRDRGINRANGQEEIFHYQVENNVKDIRPCEEQTQSGTISTISRDGLAQQVSTSYGQNLSQQMNQEIKEDESEDSSKALQVHEQDVEMVDEQRGKVDQTGIVGYEPPPDSQTEVVSTQDEITSGQGGVDTTQAGIIGGQDGKVTTETGITDGQDISLQAGTFFDQNGKASDQPEVTGHAKISSVPAGVANVHSEVGDLKGTSSVQAESVDGQAEAVSVHPGITGDAIAEVQIDYVPERMECDSGPEQTDIKEDSAGLVSECANQSRQPFEHRDKCTNFDNKLSAIGLGSTEEAKAGASQQKSAGTDTTAMAPPAAPPLPPSGSKVTGKPPRPTSLFNIVSQQKKSGAGDSPKRAGPSNTKACRKVKFDDSFDTDDSDVAYRKKAVDVGPDLKEEKEDLPESDTTEDAPTETTTEDDSDFEVVMRRPKPGQAQRLRDEDDDLSLSAFVPASVRRQSILPSQQTSGQGREEQDTSFGSLDSFEGAPGAPPDFRKSTVDLVGLGRRHAETESSSSLTSQSTTDSGTDLQARSGYAPEDTEESVDDRDAIGDLLEEAMDSESEDPATSCKPVMRKRPSHRRATEDGSLPFSINEYRASRNMQVLEVKQTIVRNSQYAGLNVREEEVEMPTRPVPAPRQSLQERVRELQELIQQEQSIIMQTSNALNQCCSSSSSFAGSTEQVECNRILLISCQKRQAYMMEIQRLRDSKTLDEAGPGPKGSFTISDIRLPLKKEFVSKIGTTSDTTTYFFILLLRNGPQVICTQMLSTHDPMMRGSLDFPNLIKVNGITGSFRLQLEIYSMSVSREHTGKDKKKKTPRKMKGSALTVQSPGGPLAVRTTSFTQVSVLPLSMRSLDKHCFNLERLSLLSPLHGTIYMNLKCLMEANVEERGFLTMFEDVSGLGSWHRRWCALAGNKLQYWKYPDDETRKDPIGCIDLKRCVTEKVGLISRDICARPNTFELTSVRQPRKGEKDTLVSRTYNTMTTIRHMLSADTKEERIVWCNKLNRALANIRTWHSDAMRPISK